MEPLLLVAVLLTAAFSAASGIFTANLFGRKLRILVYGVSGLAPIISLILVFFRINNAGPYNIFVDPAVCIVWVAIVNIAFAAMAKFRWGFHLYIFFVLFGVVMIRLLVGNIWN